MVKTVNVQDLKKKFFKTGLKRETQQEWTVWKLKLTFRTSFPPYPLNKILTDRYPMSVHFE
jgi:hypothetical protein